MGLGMTCANNSDGEGDRQHRSDEASPLGGRTYALGAADY